MTSETTSDGLPSIGQAVGAYKDVTAAAIASHDRSAELCNESQPRLNAYAEQPPDQDHRFGHDKGEALAGFTQATFLAGAAVVLAFQSVARLFFPQPPESLAIGAWGIAGSLAAASALVAMHFTGW